MPRYYMYGQQTTTYRTEVEADSIEDANSKFDDIDSGYKEVGELDWEDLPDMTEEIK